MWVQLILPDTFLIFISCFSCLVCSHRLCCHLYCIYLIILELRKQLCINARFSAAFISSPSTARSFSANVRLDEGIFQQLFNFLSCQYSLYCTYSSSYTSFHFSSFHRFTSVLTITFVPGLSFCRSQCRTEEVLLLFRGPLMMYNKWS